MAAQDIITISAILFMGGIFLFAAFYMTNQVFDKFGTLSEFNSSVATMKVITGTKESTSMFDYILLGVFIAFAMGTLVTSWYVRISPALIFAYILVGIIIIIVAGPLSNAWTSYSTSAVFGATRLSFPITDHILSNLPKYILVIFILDMLALFAKPSRAQDYG